MLLALVSVLALAVSCVALGFSLRRPVAPPPVVLPAPAPPHVVRVEVPAPSAVTPERSAIPRRGSVHVPQRITE